jgi:hypothetical protein
LSHSYAGMRGAGYPYALPMCLIDDSILLFRGHGWRTITHGRVRSDPGCIHFDEVRAILELRP